MSMPSLQRLFGLNTQKTKQKKTIAERPPEILSEKFETFKTILFSLASETGRMRAVSAISLNNKDAPYKHGNKEWVRISGSELAIRYYDVNKESCESLYTMELSAVKECFILQRNTQIHTVEEAIAVFVDLMGEYADPSFMRALKEELTACGAVDFTALTKEPAEKEQNVASADADVAVAPKPISEKLIKPAIL